MTRCIRPLAALSVLAALAFGSAACDPQAGSSCDPKKDSSYLTSHTEHGRTVTTRLECRPVGVDTTGRGLPDRYEWVKA